MVLNNRITVVMSDSRDITKLNDINYLRKVYAINKAYCEKNGYKLLYYCPESLRLFNLKLFRMLNIFCYSFKSHSFRSVHYTKIISCLKTLIDFPNIEYLVYIDSDCIFYNHNVLLENYIRKLDLSNKNILFFDDKPWSENRPSSGFFILKNNVDSIEFLKKWWEVNSTYYLKHPFEQAVLYNSYFINKIELINEWQFRLLSNNQFLFHVHNFNGNLHRDKLFNDIFNKMDLSISDCDLGMEFYSVSNSICEIEMLSSSRTINLRMIFDLFRIIVSSFLKIIIKYFR